MTDKRDGAATTVLEVVQRQLHQLATAFDAFKTEAQQLAELKGSVGGPTHVFNVSYPPFVIPMVNVHESRDGHDKTINISGAARHAHSPHADQIGTAQRQSPL